MDSSQAGCSKSSWLWRYGVLADFVEIMTAAFGDFDVNDDVTY